MNAANTAKKPSSPASPEVASADDVKASAFAKPLTPSEELAQIVGKDPLPRSEVVKRMWAYIKENDRQDPADRRSILCDAKLKAVFGGEDKVTMFAMNKHLVGHLS